MNRSDVGRLNGDGANIGAASFLGAPSHWQRSDAKQQAQGRVGTDFASPIAFDSVEALLATPDESPATDIAVVGGLASQLLEYVTPRPRNLGALQSQRIAPLLGLAARLLADHASSNSDLAELGAAAIEHELRHHQTLAERRAGTEPDAEQTVE